MFGVSDYSAFVIAVLIFLAIPGPGNLALLTSTAKGGVRGGLAATATRGMCRPPLRARKCEGSGIGSECGGGSNTKQTRQ